MYKICYPNTHTCTDAQSTAWAFIPNRSKYNVKFTYKFQNKDPFLKQKRCLSLNPPDIPAHQHTQYSHYSCWLKNKYLLTGRERAATVCPIRLANSSIHHGALLSSPPAPAPLPGQIEHVILCSHLISCSHPVTEDSLSYNEKTGGEQIWTHVPAHTPTCTCLLQTNRKSKLS